MGYVPVSKICTVNAAPITGIITTAQICDGTLVAVRAMDALAAGTCRYCRRLLQKEIECPGCGAPRSA